ncbi:hypothetical protein ACFQ21_13600 [Ohtaekwangia kribbensis]|uniref:Uncharacterized protein n=1 Tax=Ohtaekwangia kribbensis TaxID=688913 RepID=A0ABW3K251_9BACT
MTDKQKSNTQELITTLYLRLNGYLTSGFIFQSSEDKIGGEVDLVAIRFPLHRHDETEHNSSDYLEITSDIDIIIAEVKSKGQQLQFNSSLRNEQNLSKLLKWIGLFDDNIISSVTKVLQDLVTPKQNSKRQGLLTTDSIATKFGNVRVRPVIFSPERIELNNADKFINWTEINDFVWSCLCPTEKREECGTRYDFTAWGQGLNEIVKVYKDGQKNSKKPETIEEIYSLLSAEK